MTIQEIVCALERFAPLPLQDGWDNAGLQVGLTEAEVTGALLYLFHVCKETAIEAAHLFIYGKAHHETGSCGP